MNAPLNFFESLGWIEGVNSRHQPAQARYVVFAENGAEFPLEKARARVAEIEFLGSFCRVGLAINGAVSGGDLRGFARLESSNLRDAATTACRA